MRLEDLTRVGGRISEVVPLAANISSLAFLSRGTVPIRTIPAESTPKTALDTSGIALPVIFPTAVV